MELSAARVESGKMLRCDPPVGISLVELSAMRVESGKILKGGRVVELVRRSRRRSVVPVSNCPRGGWSPGRY